MTIDIQINEKVSGRISVATVTHVLIAKFEDNPHGVVYFTSGESLRLSLEDAERVRLSMPSRGDDRT